MKSIQFAIAAEEKYKRDRLVGIDNEPLIGLLEQLGYTDLEEYFEEKRIYQSREAGLSVYTSNVSNAVNTLISLITNKVCSILLVDCEEFFVYHGSEPYDRDYCNEHHINVYEVGHTGGTIVGSPGDSSIGFILPEHIDINSDWILNKFRDTLSKYFDDVRVDNNDIVLNGKKVLGSAVLRMNGMFAFVAHIAFTDSAELISSICKVEANKVPGFIPSNLSRDTLYNEVISWLL